VLENPDKVIDLLQKRMHTLPSVNTSTLSIIRKKIGHIHVLRSTELATIAFEAGILKNYVADPTSVRQPKAELIDAILWGLKLNGCAISEKEIKQIVKIESSR
jgi:hypothetical protein